MMVLDVSNESPTPKGSDNTGGAGAASSVVPGRNYISGLAPSFPAEMESAKQNEHFNDEIRKDYSSHKRVIRYISDLDPAAMPDLFGTHGSEPRGPNGPKTVAELWAHGTPDGQKVAGMSAVKLDEQIALTGKVGPNVKLFIWWVCNAGAGANPIAMQYSALHPEMIIKAAVGKTFNYGPFNVDTPYLKDSGKHWYGYTPDYSKPGSWRYFQNGKEIKGP